jgi:lysophospholipase L1-like esterase
VTTQLRRLATGLAALALACTAVVAGVAPAQASSGRYLALGDSVPFGYSPLLPIPSPPSAYVGYPELIGGSTGLRVTNLACPGQTSGGLNRLTGDDNGCFPFRQAAHLHTDYAASQLTAAVRFLKAHPGTRAVSLMIGANDLFLCQQTTADQCTSPAEVQAVLTSYAAHLTVTLGKLRSVYHGRLIGVTYYATNYADPFAVAAIQALNSVTAQAFGAAGGIVADGFTAFQGPASAFGGDTCAAGLLIKLPTGGCNVHPSPKGARLLARTVATAIRG